jgi:hypothetical protein
MVVANGKQALRPQDAMELREDGALFIEVVENVVQKDEIHARCGHLGHVIPVDRLNISQAAAVGSPAHVLQGKRISVEGIDPTFRTDEAGRGQ